MSHPTHPNDNSDSSPEELEKKVVNLWFAVAVIGLFVFACFYVLKVAIDLFLPIVLASFLGFLLTPVTRWLKKIGFSNFWAPLLGTLSFLFFLICLFAALSVSLARFEPDFPRYLDHIQERLTPIIQAVQKSSPSIDRLDGWLNPGKIHQVSIRGPSFVEIAMKNAPRFFAILIIVHVLAFFLLLYGVRDRANRSALFYFGDADQCSFGIECLDFRGFPWAAPSIALGRRRIFAPLHSLRGSDGWDRCHDARFADSFRLGVVRPFAISCLSLMCHDRKEPSDAAVSGALVSLKPYRHPVDFSSLVLPVGHGRYSAGCSPPCDLQNILRSY